MSNIYQHNQLQERQSAPLALNNSVSAKDKVSLLGETKLSVVCHSGNTRLRQRGRMSSHSVFVLCVDGKPLTPTSPSKARKLLKGGQACKIWSKFNTFGIQLIVKTRKEIPNTCLGYDPGTKFEGFSVVVDKENNLNVKLDLPDKKKIVKKLKERREARRARRSRLRRRQARFNNRNRKRFISPSQSVVVRSRLKIIGELCRIYPVNYAAIEDVKFNHAKYRWGKNFSTIEIGKSLIRNWFKERHIKLFEYQGFETKELREKYGYKKSSSKRINKFESHCCDSLSLAIALLVGERVKPGKFLVVDDTYRCVRRKIHDSNIKPGGLREKYSCGTVKGLKKGLIIGVKSGKIGQLCGKCLDSFGFRGNKNKRNYTKKIVWINNHFKVKEQSVSPQDKSSLCSPSLTVAVVSD